MLSLFPSRQTLVRTALCFLALCCATSFGVELVTEEAASEQITSFSADEKELLAMDEQSLNQSVEFLKERLRQLELEHGPYHSSIAENLLRQAQVYFVLGQHQQARNATQHALEVQRISAGLYDKGQIPIVEQLIRVNKELKTWETVDTNYRFLYWLYRRAYGENSAELITVLELFINWKLDALNYGLLTSREALVKDALIAARRANGIISMHPELQHLTARYSRLERSLREAREAESVQSRSILN